ncbi:hypothetical protein ABK040_006004 [Willaertia magna]
MQSFEPENTSEYKLKSYWDKRFEKEEVYDWLGTYKQWKEHLDIHLLNNVDNKKKEDLKILIIGCGNSTLSNDLYEDGYKNITNIDYSATVIEKMKEKYPYMNWVEMDVTNMEKFENNSFDFVLDKGTMDALVVDAGDPWDPEIEVRNMVLKMCQEIYRILKIGGKYLQISFQQPHFRKLYLLPKKDDQLLINWEYSCKEVDGIGLGYFLFTCKKN